MSESARGRLVMVGPALDVRGGVSAVERLIVEGLAGRFALRHIATVRDRSAHEKFSLMPAALRALAHELKASGPKLVHIHFASRGSTLRKSLIASRTLRAGVPLVLHAHGGGYREFWEGLPGPVRQWLRKLFGRADRFIVLSEGWKEFYVQEVRVNPERLRVLSNPAVVPARVPDRGGRDHVQLLFLGRIGQAKGCWDLLHAIAVLPADVLERVRLVMAGDGDVEHARALVTRLGLEGHVTILSWVEPARRDALIEASDLFVLPSYREGVPMAMLEALASGLPALATPVGGIPDVLRHGENGWIVPPGEVAALAEAIATLVRDEPRRLALGVAARASVLPWSAERYLERLVSVYEELLPTPWRPAATREAAC